MTIVGRLAFAAFLLSLVVGLVACVRHALSRLGLSASGFLKIFPFCLAMPARPALLLGAAWAIAALLPQCGNGVRTMASSVCWARSRIMAVPLYTLYMVQIAHAIPPIHDISTDTEYPPQFVALLTIGRARINPPDYDGPNARQDI